MSGNSFLDEAIERVIIIKRVQISQDLLRHNGCPEDIGRPDRAVTSVPGHLGSLILSRPFELWSSCKESLTIPCRMPPIY